MNVGQAETLVDRLLVLVVGEEARHHVLDVRSHVSRSVEQVHDVSALVSLQIQEAIQKVFVDFVSIFTPNGRLEQLVKVDCVEELLQLPVENLHLVLEVPRKRVVTSDPVDDVLASAQIAWVRAPVQLVLKRVLDLVFEVLGDVVPVRDIPDPRQRHSLHELVRERGQVSLDATNDEAVLLSLELVVELLVQPVRDSCMVVRPEVPLLAAMDVARRDEVKEGGDRSQAFRLEPVAAFVLIGNVGGNLEFLAPGGTLGVFLHDALDQLPSFGPQLAVLLLSLHHLAKFLTNLFKMINESSRVQANNGFNSHITSRASTGHFIIDVNKQKPNLKQTSQVKMMSGSFHQKHTCLAPASTFVVKAFL